MKEIQETWVQSLGQEDPLEKGKIPWRRDRLPSPVFLGFPGGSDGKQSTCSAETWVQFLGWEDLLEEGMVTHSSIIAPWTEKPGKLQFMGLQRVDTNERLNTAQHTKVKTQFVSGHT